LAKEGTTEELMLVFLIGNLLFFLDMIQQGGSTASWIHSRAIRDETIAA
jgi:hypothetical protein